LRQDAIAFRSGRKSLDGKRHASIPVFVKNPDGSQGRIKRQCTKEYKIEVVERIIRRLVLGLKPRQRAPRKLAIEHWFGISTDEARRMSYPGRWVRKQKAVQGHLFDGGSEPVWGKVWQPCLWEARAYPLCGTLLLSDRKSRLLDYLPHNMTRDDCREWLEKRFPDRVVPRSACLGCPFRSNAEWREMRDQRPTEWADAVAFDHDQRAAVGRGQERLGLLVGLPFVHRQLVPLDLVDLDGDGEHDGTHCGFLSDGQDGLCGV
jgi:hypothetical protein